jgi:hypothetical protein
MDARLLADAPGGRGTQAPAGVACESYLRASGDPRRARGGTPIL